MEQMDYADRVAADMEVCDIAGEKIGTVAGVHRYAMAGTGSEATRQDDYFEVKSGFLGLGKHMYIPMSAVHDVTEGCIFIDKSKDAIDGLGWDVEPGD
jgi:hypothetical protein